MRKQEQAWYRAYSGDETPEQVRVLFAARFGAPPAEILRVADIWLAGPLPHGQAPARPGEEEDDDAN